MTPSQQTVYGYFPLWGASFDSEDSGLVGGQDIAMIPYLEEWRFIQKSDVWKERMKHERVVNPEFSDQAWGPPPPLCLVVVEQLDSKEDFARAASRLMLTMRTAAQDALLALRLHKPGWCIDPDLTEWALVKESSIIRSPGPYRQAFMMGVPEGTPQGYVLGINELTGAGHVKGPVSTLYDQIVIYRLHANSAADIAIENFTRSFGYQLAGVHRVAFLFTVIDAMLGGMSARRIGDLKLKRRFRQPVTAALQAPSDEPWIGVDATAEELAMWLDTAGRSIRNAIAHGEARKVAQEAENNWMLLQAIVRIVLRQFIRFSIKWNDEKTTLSKRLNLDASAALVQAYNRALERGADGDEAVLDLLSFNPA